MINEMKYENTRYIGITGFKTEQEVQAITSHYQGLVKEKISKFPSERKSIPQLMVGILSNEEMVQADKSGQSLQKKQTPQIREIYPLLDCLRFKDYVLPMIHYHSKSNSNFVDDISDILHNEDIFRKYYCDAVQLNISWPMPYDLRYLKENFSGLKTVLQLNKAATETMSLSQISNRLREYDYLADYVLIDMSGGKGIELDVSHTVELMDMTTDIIPKSNLVIAGGFDSKTILERIPIIKEKTKIPFSVDAQGKLRSEDKCSLDLPKCYDYLDAAFDVL